MTMHRCTLAARFVREAVCPVLVLALMAGTRSVMAQPVAESEPNNAKPQANPRFGQFDGLVATGVTTGSSTSVAGTTSTDYFRIQSPFRQRGLYRHRLVLSSPTAGLVGSIRGRSQMGGFADANSDVGVQTSIPLGAVSVFNQFYSQGNPGPDIYYRVTGTPATTGQYSVTLETLPIAPIRAGVFRANVPMTVSTVGEGPTADTEITNFTAIGNDDAGPDTQQSTLVFTPINGTSTIAISDFNLCNSSGSIGVGEGFRDGNVLDFIGTVVCSSTQSNVNMSFSMTDGTVTRRYSAVKPGPFDVVFVEFTVVDDPCYADFNSDGTLNPDDLADYISGFFGQPPNPAADFSGDGLIDPDDLADYIAAFFAGCA